MKYILSSLIIFLFLTGCYQEPVIKYVPVTTTKYVSIDKHLLDNNITLPIPPNRDKYIHATPNQRTRMLTNHIIDLYSVIKDYKLKLKHIKQYNNKMIKLYKNKK